MEELEDGVIARYCKPSTLDEQRNPTSSSFQLRAPDEKFLSVYLLDFFGDAEEAEQVKSIRDTMQDKGFKLRSNGLFAVLSIQEPKDYIVTMINEQISCKALILPHCGIFHEHDDLVISELLSQSIRNTYAGTQ